MSQPWVNHGGIVATPESDPSSLSPRTELLSPEPLHEPHPPLRVPRGPSVKFRRERERAHSTTSPHELLRMLIHEEYESKQTRKVLYTAFDRLEQETKRADAAEARIEETIRRARAINEARIASQGEVARTKEQLNRYKLQFDNAQQEIHRAQEVLKAIEAQRDEAENAALEARSKARRLNEERLIELAREEGRRLGFEEGVRRGRRLVVSYQDGYENGRQEEVATEAVERLLDAREEEQEEIEVLEAPTPIPPPSSSRTAPEVHRLETPVNSSLESQRHNSRSTRDSTDSTGRSTLRRAAEPVVPPPIPPPAASGAPPAPSQSLGHQPAPQPQPWPAPPPHAHVEQAFDRPVSVRNSPPSVYHSEIHVPPDGYIPTVDENNNINLPPPHELHRTIPSPTPERQPMGRPERRSSRDYIYDNSQPPRRPSPDESLSSTKQSASSTISQLDIVGLPSSSKRRERSQGLSVIHEDPSVRSGATTPHSQTVASISQGRHSHRGMERESNETLDPEMRAKQQFADELRYSDPTQPAQWRRYAESSRSQSSVSAPPPTHRPVIPTIPTPLSPPKVLQDPRHRRGYSERQGRPATRSDHNDQQRPLSSDSSVPEISVEPPSGPPSDAPSRGHGTIPPNGFLSPDHANRPLPIPAPAPPPDDDDDGPFTPSPPHSPKNPRANLAGEIYNVSPNARQLPAGFFPSASASGSSQQGPVIPQNTGGSSSAQTHRYTVPYGAPSSERESGRSKTPISFYAQSPVPAGFTYPAPPISRSATYSAPSHAGSAPSEPRRRRDSLNVSAGMTPAMRARPIQSIGSSTEGATGSTRESRLSKRQSNASLGSQQAKPSYNRYNPSMYNDPAYLASNDSLVDSVTNANTAGNGGGGAPVRTRGQRSSEYTYEQMGTHGYE